MTTHHTNKQQTHDDQRKASTLTDTPTSKRSRTSKKSKSSPMAFKSAYDILKTNAEKLQSQQEPDIDNLMTLVEESIAAYHLCQARIDAVSKALEQVFAQEAMPTQRSASTTTTSTTNSDADKGNTKELD